MSLRLPLRLIFFVFAGILLFTTCSSFPGSKPSTLTTSQLENLRKSKGNYHFSGRILFKHPKGKHSGELALQISRNSELKLSIFTPFVGSLIYELRASNNKILILNFQEKNFVLADNNQETRQTWLGMDISLTELKWLILGQLPEKTPAWRRKKLSGGELLLTQGTTEIRLRFNASGQIETMHKFLEGLLEFRARIPIYQKHYDLPFPRKISIEDYSGNSKWLMVFSEIQTPSGTMKALDLKPPPNLRQLKSNQ